MYSNSYRPSTQFSVFPPVIKNLLIINGLVFMAQLVPSTNLFLTEWFALWPLKSAIGDFFPWQLVTYGFMHSTQSLGHIFFNMFALWMFGVPLETRWGPRRFAIFYFICVIGAGLAQLAATALDGTGYPTIGASGGVFGILMAFGLLFPDQPIYVYFLFPIKAKWFVIIYGLIEFYGGVAGAQSGVAHFAHLGGMFFGLILILYWQGKLPIPPRRRTYY